MSANTATPGRRAAYLRLGLRLVAPILVGVAPFGAIYGIVALQSGLSPAMTMAMSTIVFAGSVPFLLAQLIGTAPPALIIIGACGQPLEAAAS